MTDLLHFYVYNTNTMSEIGDAIQAKCLAFGDRVIKLNDYLLKEAANKKPDFKIVKGKRVYEKTIPVHLQAVSNRRLASHFIGLTCFIAMGI